MKNEIDIEKRILKRILVLPPYQFVTEHIEHIMEDYSHKDYSKERQNVFKRNYSLISRDLNKDINEMLRIVEIEEDLIKLIESTDNKIFYRKLFFPSIFINNEFKFNDWIIKGMLVEECFSDFNTGMSKPSLKNESEKNDYVIFMIAVQPETREFWSLTFNLVNRYMHIGDDKYGNINIIEDYLRTIICNTVDMVEGNDQDLNITIIETSKEQNEKRVKRGKIQFPTKVYIRAKGEFKKYVQDFNKNFEDSENKLGHKFLVRGHWRNFRSTRFIRKKGERTWIKPFFKGKGIVISKDYKLVRPKDII